MNNTFAFLLAGGEGKRLGAMTDTKPKPLIPFAGKFRLIDFPLSNAAISGVRKLGLLVQASQKSIIDYVHNGASWGLDHSKTELLILPSKSHPANPDNYRGTADAIRQNMALIKADQDCDTIMILAADHVYKMDYSELIDFHRKHNAEVTVAITDVPPAETHKFGIVNQDNRNRIIKWEEKPANARSTLASMGIYVFSKKFLVQAFEKCQGHDFGHHILPFACQHARIFGFRFSDYWRDVGTPDAYWQSNMDLLDPQKTIDLDEWEIKTNRSYQMRDREAESNYIASSAIIENSIISEKCLVKGRAINSIIFPGVRIDKNVDIRNSIIMNNCSIASDSRIENTILCDQASIGKGACIGCTKSVLSPFGLVAGDQIGLVVIGEKILVKRGERIHKNSMLSSKIQHARINRTAQRRKPSFTNGGFSRRAILNNA